MELVIIQMLHSEFPLFFIEENFQKFLRATILINGNSAFCLRLNFLTDSNSCFQDRELIRTIAGLLKTFVYRHKVHIADPVCELGIRGFTLNFELEGKLGASAGQVTRENPEVRSCPEV